MKAKILILTIILILGCVLLWYRFPLLGEEMNKQTMYVGVLDALYGNSSDSIAHAMWIDDDSGEGIFDVKRIADELGIQPVFAVIADNAVFPFSAVNINLTIVKINIINIVALFKNFL